MNIFQWNFLTYPFEISLESHKMNGNFLAYLACKIESNEMEFIRDKLKEEEIIPDMLDDFLPIVNLRVNY
jgi:hypothetical protein